MTTNPTPEFKRRSPNATRATCDLCRAHAKWTLGGSRYCDKHAGKQPDPTPEAPGYVSHEDPCEECKRRNETDQLTRLEGQLDRIADILGEIRDARRGRYTQKPPTPEEIQAFARGGIVKAPAGHQPPIINRGCDLVITAEQARTMGVPTLDELRERGRLE